MFLFSIWLTGTRTRTRVAIEVGDGYRKENIDSLYHQKYQMEYTNGSLQISCKLLLPTKPIVSDSKEITYRVQEGYRPENIDLNIPKQPKGISHNGQYNILLNILQIALIKSITLYDVVTESKKVKLDDISFKISLLWL